MLFYVIHVTFCHKCVTELDACCFRPSPFFFLSLFSAFNFSPRVFYKTAKWEGRLSFHCQRRSHRMIILHQTLDDILSFLPPSPRWQAKITHASAKLHAHREKVPYVIFSERENGSGLFFLKTLYPPYSVDRARMIAIHQPAILNTYVWTLHEKKKQFRSSTIYRKGLLPLPRPPEETFTQ